MNQTTALQVIEPEVIAVERLDVIAADIRQEWGRGIEAQFTIGGLLAQARALHGDDDKAFGIWLKAQDFGFSGSTAYNLRIGFERQDEVRAFLTSRSSASRDMGVNTAIARMTRQLDEATERRGATEGADHIGFLSFRSGIHRLLGWVVGDDLVGSATKNELMQLPDDQLTELKALVEALAKAFAEARKARLVAMA